MRLACALLLLLDRAASLASDAAGRGGLARAACSRRSAAVSMESELNYRKRMEKEGLAGAEKIAREQAALDAAEARPGRAAAAPDNAAVAAYIDDVNVAMFGARGGGVLTREAIRNAEITTSPALQAMEDLAAAVKDAGGRSAAESAAALRSAIDDASAANVPDKNPQLVKAVGLLAALDAAEEQRADATAPPEPDGLASKLDSVFGGYAEPSYELDDMMD